MNTFSKIPVAILGATGMVGQQFIALLSDHPWFELVAVCASEKSQGKKYAEAVRWMLSTSLSQKIGEMIVTDCRPSLPCQVVFSGLDSSVAGEIELCFAENGYFVISNSKNHRMDSAVPLVVPEINASHLNAVKVQPYKDGAIVTNPNCSVIGLSLALKPLLDKWGIEKVHVVTMQAVSGAGYPGVSSFDIMDNVIPYISGEEEKLETEPLKILGNWHHDRFESYSMQISAHCNRVPVIHGHTECVSIKLCADATELEIIDAWQSFSSLPQILKLPSAPKHPIIYLNGIGYPQPKLHRDLQDGMAVAIGQLRRCPLFDWKFTLLSHNIIRGAAGCAVLNAELLFKQGFIKSR